MDIPRLQSFNEYTRTNPPLHLMVRNYLKAGKPRVKKVTQADESTVVELNKLGAGTTPPYLLAIYKGGRIPKIGEPLWPTTQSR